MKTLAVREPDLFVFGYGVQLSPVGMTLPDSIDEDQWNEIGDQVMRLETASNWILGDWWAHGQHLYGERKKWVAEQKAKRSQVKSFKTLHHYGTVCRAFESARRRALVSFEMHRELLGLSEAKQDKFLDLIEAGEIKTHKELKAKLGYLKDKPKPVSHRAICPLVIEMFLGTCVVNDPVPSWRTVEDQIRENNQTIVCTECWTHSTGGEIQHSPKERLWTFACHCPDSTRTTYIKLRK
jgi:hypothetical protein